MFLSRVEIAWDAARNPYNLHRQLWRLFPGQGRESRKNAAELRQGFLFRIEENLPGRATRLLVQSRDAPDGAARPLGLIAAPREFHPQPSAGQRLAFLLTANPIKTIVDADRTGKPDKRSEKCRVPLIREEGQREWLNRKLAGAATVEAVSILPHAPLYFRKGGQGGKLLTVTFEGVVCVNDPERFIKLIENGVGPAKAFGCGLLLVRRLNSV